MTRKRGLAAAVVVVAAVVGASVSAQSVRPSSCSQCPAWNETQKPFRVFGNVYYVGVAGLSSVLVTSSDGHVLLDGALPESVPKVLANIKTVGVRIQDVKLILNSHVHFDHAGGIGELKRLSGARVAASASTAKVMATGESGLDDPQYGVIAPIETVRNVQVVKDGETLRVGSLALTAHMTPGHTPGGTTWSWRSCEGARCLNVVYADSLNAVSRDGFLFTRSETYPAAMQDFEKSFATVAALPCDILLTPHPGFSSLLEKFTGRENRTSPDAFVDPSSCRQYVASARDAVNRRVMSERRQN